GRSSSGWARRRGSSDAARSARRPSRELPELRRREPGGAKVLLGVRIAAGARMRCVRRGQRAGGTVLRRVRHRDPAGARGTGAAVPELAPTLKARAAVLTGEAAVTLGAEGQGMVAGDLVNTASRVQAAAEPGAVVVGETTRRASEAAIAYEDAGTHELKGKAE